MTQPDPHPDLTFATFRVGDPGPDAGDERVGGWIDAQRRGFHQGRGDEALHRHYRTHLHADDALLRGAWETRPALGSGAVPVATYASFDKDLNVGARRLPVRMITDVTVAATHRRRGLLRRLISADLAEAAAAGLPLAALTVSEGTIYGRFGFGLAVEAREVEVDTGTRFRLRGTPPGTTVIVDPREGWPTVRGVFDAFHDRGRGSIARPQFYEPMLTGDHDFENGGPDRMLQCAVHLGADGRPDGHVVYKPEGRDDRGRQVRVVDLVAVTPEAYLALWRHLADVDLVASVRWRRAPVDDPLPWALVDPFAVKVVGVSDALWVRVLDVVAALEGRDWGADGEVVLGVDDPLGHAGGHWRVTTRGGEARVEPTDAPATVSLAAETLGAHYLGGVRTPVLAAAGRLTGADDALATWAAMADTGPTPWCLTGF
ncbi:GNAT family N-acetyltransferase [Nocardioides sp. SYSU D00038]|uniref:GNAT family N-acetyltransferase n=1 Tax=Nocardioides sp. SYSU D00038 TaxID=2812554 RepID=UPI00196716C1|nr:GNAT family N-acetyltransferase [Nocardioides sp. SYSU D00038]